MAPEWESNFDALQIFPRFSSKHFYGKKPFSLHSTIADFPLNRNWRWYVREKNDVGKIWRDTRLRNFAFNSQRLLRGKLVFCCCKKLLSIKHFLLCMKCVESLFIFCHLLLRNWTKLIKKWSKLEIYEANNCETFQSKLFWSFQFNDKLYWDLNFMAFLKLF